MKIYDITQEVFSCNVFPGDPEPKTEQVLKISEGAICNLTKIEMCSHNGTHLDAPKHFFEDGMAIDEIPLEKFVGPAYVVEHSGELSGQQAEEVIKSVGESITEPDGVSNAEVCSSLKLLFKKKDGDANAQNTVISLDAAKVFNQYGVELVGVESQTVGPEDAPAEVHYELLGREVILLEGIVLDEVPKGRYFLSAAPIKLGGSDGAPCRAVLIDML